MVALVAAGEGRYRRLLHLRLLRPSFGCSLSTWVRWKRIAVGIEEVIGKQIFTRV